MAAAPDPPARTVPPSPPEAPAAAQQQPESLTDLPLAWLRRMVTSWDARCSLEVLVRTCTAMRNLVLESRRASVHVGVPVRAEHFQGVLDRLCVAARRSRNVMLAIRRSGNERWSVTEGSAAHLLQSAVGQLGGPLTGVVEVRFEGMEVECVAPRWLAAACPNVRSVTLAHCSDGGGEEEGEEESSEEVDSEGDGEEKGSEDDEEEDMEEDVEQQHQHQQEEHGLAPLAFRHLTSMALTGCRLPPLASPGGTRLCQQLRALTALRRLELDSRWDFTHPALVSSSATELGYQREGSHCLTSLPVQFPVVRDVNVHFLTLDDGDLDAVLSLRNLRALRVSGFDLRHSHAQQRCALETLTFTHVDVDSFSRLPWSGVQACRSRWTVAMVIKCSGSTEATAAVTAALQQRLRGADVGGSPETELRACSSIAVLEATLPLAALMRSSRQLSIHDVHDVSATVLQRLGQLVRVPTLLLLRCSLTEDAWPALLPALPHTSSMYLLHVAPFPTEQQLVAMCQSATRPVRVDAWDGSLSEGDADALCQRVMQAAGNGHVTLTLRC